MARNATAAGLGTAVVRAAGAFQPGCTVRADRVGHRDGGTPTEPNDANYSIRGSPGARRPVHIHDVTDRSGSARIRWHGDRPSRRMTLERPAPGAVPVVRIDTREALVSIRVRLENGMRGLRKTVGIMFGKRVGGSSLRADEVIRDAPSVAAPAARSSLQAQRHPHKNVRSRSRPLRHIHHVVLDLALCTGRLA